MEKHLGRRALVALVAAFAMLIAVAPAADARTDSKDKRVLLLHGYQPWGTPTSPCDMWGPMETALRAQGYTGELTSVQYYDAQVACDVSVIPHGSASKHHPPSGGVHDRYVSIRHLGYELAWMIYDRYSRNGQTVDVAAHSMGGLVVRYALAQVQRGNVDFPPYLYVEDVVTMGTPHNGSGYASWCWTTQCGEMSAGSSFLSWLRSYAWNPQVSGGTDWTAMGSYDDGTVSESSAVDMGAAHKVLYTGAANIDHGHYYTSTSTATTAPVTYSDNGGAWYSWSSGYWPVRWTSTSMHLGTW
jgi:hypothetical protein